MTRHARPLDDLLYPLGREPWCIRRQNEQSAAGLGEPAQGGSSVARCPHSEGGCLPPTGGKARLRLAGASHGVAEQYNLQGFAAGAGEAGGDAQQRLGSGGGVVGQQHRPQAVSRRLARQQQRTRCAGSQQARSCRIAMPESAESRA